ncbi:MAG TPA: hypothetical protein VK195_18570 [Burkholderiaceae bacterium]|nr:hypothetical protein [Burkholderiaceae bacterium]
MTNEPVHSKAETPFLLRFSEVMPPQPGVRMRYDPVRQVSDVEVDGQWVEATSQNVLNIGTMVTRVQSETTDDK